MAYNIEVNCDYNVLIRNIENIIESSSEYGNIGFDIYFDDKSEIKLKKIGENKYSLAFTRPAFNASASNAFDFILLFKPEQLDEGVSIKGKIRLKLFISIFLILFSGIYFFLLIKATEFDIMTILFFTIIPIYLPLYIFKQHKRFKNRANLFFQNQV